MMSPSHFRFIPSEPRSRMTTRSTSSTASFPCSSMALRRVTPKQCPSSSQAQPLKFEFYILHAAPQQAFQRHSSGHGPRLHVRFLSGLLLLATGERKEPTTNRPQPPEPETSARFAVQAALKDAEIAAQEREAA